MYEQQAQAGGAGPDMGNMGADMGNMGADMGGSSANDDVVDGDYREV
jgi:molecular chaperone DnaK